MKVSLLLPLAAASFAFVLPEQDVLANIESDASRAVDRVPCPGKVHDELEAAADRLKESFDSVSSDVAHEASDRYEEAWSSTAHWGNALSNKAKNVYESATDLAEDVEGVLKDFEERFDESTTLGLDGFDSDRPHHRRPHHGHKPNLTVYEMIAKSKYTTKLAELINEFPDLVDALNGTKANYTVFAFTDEAFEKLPDYYKKPSKETLKKALSYHVSAEFYPAGRILTARTIPTLLQSKALGKHAGPQRLGTEIGLRGLTVNYYSRVVAPNIFGTNGVIHGIDSPLVLPPQVLDIVNLLPGDFSTLELAIYRTELMDELNSTDIKGATFFAPTNYAFQKLGSATNAFLFSHYGTKYLKAIIKYHVVPNKVIYSDAYYQAGSAETLGDDESSVSGVPRGSMSVAVPTLLGKPILLNYARYGRLIDIQLNGYSRVSDSDFVAEDGVLHEITGVLIPPRKLASGVFEEWDGESEMSPEELMERLEDLVE